MFKELALFEHQLIECRFIADLVEQNVFIPPGFNQNAIDLGTIDKGSQKPIFDFSSMIACALSSNLYLNGLNHLDYLSMQANVKPFNGNFMSSDGKSGGVSEHNEIMMAAASATDEYGSEIDTNKKV